MSISTNSSTATDYITSQWKALGADVQIASLDVTTFSTRAQHGQFQAYVGAIPNIGYMSGPDPTKGGLNFSGVENPNYDQVVASALAAPTIQDGCPYWKQVQLQIAQNYWVLPLFAQPTPNITYVRKGISFQVWGGLSPIVSVPTYRLGVLSK
jgi:ABC-type transport system substrate-binding protein